MRFDSIFQPNAQLLPFKNKSCGVFLAQKFIRLLIRNGIASPSNGIIMKYVCYLVHARGYMLPSKCLAFIVSYETKAF